MTKRKDVCAHLEFDEVKALCDLQFEAGVCGHHDIDRINDEWHGALGAGKLSSNEPNAETAREFVEQYVRYLKTQ